MISLLQGANDIRIAHISDIHYRGSMQRHDEYRHVLGQFIVNCSRDAVHHIVVTGDIFHTKTQGISPEVIDELSWFFSSMADVAPVHMILGNHDGNLMNRDRQDAITPIVSALGDDRINLYKRSGCYRHGRLNFCVFSCFDVQGWSNVTPCVSEGALNIALYHGTIAGSVTDDGWVMNEGADIKMFDAYDFTMLGDIHQQQIVCGKQNMRYPGSAIQQGYGESTEKGYLLWSIRDSVDYDVKSIILVNDQPFVTLEWSDDDASLISAAASAGASPRCRIRSQRALHQDEIKRACALLKEHANASEIVFKIDRVQQANIAQTSVRLLGGDLFELEAHKALLSDYVTCNSLHCTDVELLHAMLKQALEHASGDESLCDVSANSKWSLKKLEFSNVFAYGRDNVINFEKLRGIIGVFAPNRAGKSSIVGALMYALFNGTDRGSIGNLHVINSRKGHCDAKVIVDINDHCYVINRQTVRYEAKAGTVHGITHLNFFESIDGVNVDVDHNGEQRADTDRAIRRKIGTADDFLMTSFASQGSMNQFIFSGASQRRNLLSRLLGLDVFEKMLNHVKTGFDMIKLAVRRMSNKAFDTVIDQLGDDITRIEDRILHVMTSIDAKQLMLDGVDNQLVALDSVIRRIDDAARGTQRLDELHASIASVEKQLVACHAEQAEIDVGLTRIDAGIATIDCVAAQSVIDEHTELTALRSRIEHTHVQLTAERKALLRSVERLDGVPCGDAFPSCKYIRDAIISKRNMPSLDARIDAVNAELAGIDRKLDLTSIDDSAATLAKHDALVRDRGIFCVKRDSIMISIASVSASLVDLRSRLVSEEHRHALAYGDMLPVDSHAHGIDALRQTKRTICDELRALRAEHVMLAMEIGAKRSEHERVCIERDECVELLKKHAVYELLLGALSTKGIPTFLLRQLLPIVNERIAQVLHGVVEFTVEIELESDSNNVHVYVNYGDSRRMIELASGMEKMIAALAIRVALIGVSSLPKTDIFIIDEGFGVLDDVGIDACCRMLNAIKRWFKTIVIITHVDAIKDVVDGMIEITHDGKDAHVRYV